MNIVIYQNTVDLIKN